MLVKMKELRKVSRWTRQTKSLHSIHKFLDDETNQQRNNDIDAVVHSESYISFCEIKDD